VLVLHDIAAGVPLRLRGPCRWEWRVAVVLTVGEVRGSLCKGSIRSLPDSIVSLLDGLLKCPDFQASSVCPQFSFELIA
jgi:hypothetical protein